MVDERRVGPVSVGAKVDKDGPVVVLGITLPGDKVTVSCTFSDPRALVAIAESLREAAADLASMTVVPLPKAAGSE